MGLSREIENEVVALPFPRLRHDISIKYCTSRLGLTEHEEMVADFGLIS